MPVSLHLGAVLLAVAAGADGPGGFVDATAAAGLDGISAGRCKLADLDGDGRPDVIANGRAGEPPAVFLNRWPAPFRRLEDTGLPALARGDLVVFADLDDDGRADALVTRFVEDPAARPERTAVHLGAGDGTFGPARVVEAAPPVTTCAIAVGDADLDGALDLLLGNWYRAYGESLDGFENDLLRRDRAGPDALAFTRVELAHEEGADDAGGRPTYGALFLDTRVAQAVPDWSNAFRAGRGAGPDPHEGGVALLELSYGRRWNRLWRARPAGASGAAGNSGALGASGGSAWTVDPATHRGIDGDAIRHGRHPAWLAERAKTDPRFDREDEAPFRANGNTFDAAVGDIDGDGDLDLFLAEITHAWAGDSSDRSRFLVNRLAETGALAYVAPEALAVDRIPQGPGEGDLQRWNQGDIFCGLADFDHDGRLDLLLCSSDYPDPPPHDERLRIFLQQGDGTFADATTALGIDHVGAGQPSIGDVDGDGDLDILVGQSFSRMTPELRRRAGLTNGSLDPGAPPDAKPAPRMKLLLNEATGDRRSVTLRLRGDGKRVSRDALGALVRCTVAADAARGTPAFTRTRSLVGIGGHAGKQDEFLVHFGVGTGTRPVEIQILWAGRPDAPITTATLAPGARVELASDAAPAAVPGSTPRNDRSP